MRQLSVIISPSVCQSVFQIDSTVFLFFIQNEIAFSELNNTFVYLSPLKQKKKTLVINIDAKLSDKEEKESLKKEFFSKTTF